MADAPGWVRLTELSPVSGGSLLGAVMTTYDPPDASVLVEDLLPAWLGLDVSYTEDGATQQRYFAELERELQRLRGRIAIISTPASAATGGASSGDAWLWHYIHRLEVGARRDAVQHAKLWMFHRAPAPGMQVEHLEVVVSSANLTRDGIKGQLQAGWRCIVPLRQREAATTRRTWSLLAPFLAELGRSCGERGERTLETWIRLLGRAECPTGIRFVASVPGTHDRATLRTTPWGTSGLRKLWTGRGRKRMTIVVPTIGHWSANCVQRFGRSAEVGLEQVKVAWIRTGHRWTDRWSLPKATVAAWNGGPQAPGVPIQWGEIADLTKSTPPSSPFPEEYRETDRRWPHAKLYECTQGTHRWLLLTSANFSRAAWGTDAPNGSTRIANFELGVAVRTDHGLARHLGTRDFPKATTSDTEDERIALQIAWAAVYWTGRQLRIACRLALGATLNSVVVVSAVRRPPRHVKAQWTRDHKGTLPWPLARGVPVQVTLTSLDGEVRTIPVLDVRPPLLDQPPVCDRFDEHDLEEMMARLAEERYGYRLAPDGDAPASGTEDEPPGNGRLRSDGYDVAAYVDARRRFGWIDTWRQEYDRADKTNRPEVLEDGRRVERYWTRQTSGAGQSLESLPATLAVKELRTWLREFSR